MEIGCVVLGGFRHFSWGNESDGGVGGRVVVRGGQSSAMRMPEHAKNLMSSFLCEGANLVSCVAWRLKL